MHIPIIDPKNLDDYKFDVLVVFAYEYAPTIIGKTKKYNVKYFSPIPFTELKGKIYEIFIPKDIQEIIENCHSDLVALKGQKILLTGSQFLGRYFTSVFSEFNKQSDEKIAIVGLDNHISSGEFGVWLGNSKIENLSFTS